MVVHFIAAAILLAQSPQQFDLECTGTMTSGSTNTPTREKPTSSRYRVDLDRMVWCVDDCAAPRGFVRANAAELVLIDETRPDGGSHRTVINRVTGALRSRIEMPMGGPSIHISTDAICRKADYTPIPTAAF